MSRSKRFALPLSLLAVALLVVACSKQEEAVSPEETAKLIKPVASVETAGAAAAGAAGGPVDGKKIYETACAACHAVGAAGAPKAGDKGAWGPRIAKGKDTLYASALNGKGAMPAKGGNPALSDAEIKAAVDTLVALAK